MYINRVANSLSTIDSETMFKFLPVLLAVNMPHLGLYGHRTVLS